MAWKEKWAGFEWSVERSTNLFRTCKKHERRHRQWCSYSWWAKKAFGLVDKGRDNNNPTGAKPTNQRGGRSLTSLNSSGCGEGGVSGWLTGQKLEDSREQRAWSQAGQPGWWGSDLGVWRWGSGARWRDGLERPLRGNRKWDLMLICSAYTLWSMKALTEGSCSCTYFGFKEQKCTQVKLSN